jgi:hypothetical protein
MISPLRLHAAVLPCSGSQVLATVFGFWSCSQGNAEPPEISRSSWRRNLRSFTQFSVTYFLLPTASLGLTANRVEYLRGLLK